MPYKIIVRERWFPIPLHWDLKVNNIFPTETMCADNWGNLKEINTKAWQNMVTNMSPSRMLGLD